MIEVAQAIIDEYLTDSVNKEIVIDGSHKEGILPTEVNYYTGGVVDTQCYYEITSTSGFMLYAKDNDYEWNDDVEWRFYDGGYVIVAINLQVDLGSTVSTTGTWSMNYADANGVYWTKDITTDDLSRYDGAPAQLVLTIPEPVDGLTNIRTIYFTPDDTTTLVAYYIHEKRIQVNFTGTSTDTPEYTEAPDFTDYDPDDYIPYRIDNDNLVYEDFTLTESLCSQDNIKFGLCEAAHIEFSEVGVNAPRVGDKMSVTSTLPEYPVSIPNSVLESIDFSAYPPSEQNSVSYTFDPSYISRIGWYKNDLTDYYSALFAGRYIAVQMELELDVTAYSPVKPGWFKLALQLINEDGTTVRLYFNKFYSVADFEGSYATVSGYFPTTYNGKKLVKVDAIMIGFYKPDKTLYARNDSISVSYLYQRKQLHSMEDMWDGTGACPIPAWDADTYYVYNGTLNSVLAPYSSTIPLGVYKIASVENEYKHNLIRKKITAYDNLLKLEDNAADWYTRYMFGVDTYGYNSNGFEYARQIYSSYWNYVDSIGLDSKDNYDVTLVAEYPDNDFIANDVSNYKYIKWQKDNVTYYLCYAMKEVSVTDNTLLYRVTWDNYDGETDEYRVGQWFKHYTTLIDELGRGAIHNGGVLIEEYKSGASAPYNCFCVNSGDFFALSEDTAFFRFLLPSGNKNTAFSLCVNVTLETAPKRSRLVNDSTRLCYYNYSTKDIFACESSITGRDVVRSLLEVCGCFFRLDRSNGLPEFVYPTKGGLYPSNTLYPADDLYPRAGTNMVVSTGKYISVRAENYQVKSYGRIQILKKIKSSNTESVVEWQYVGNSRDPNTYVIDDNIFYCAEEMEYDYDGMPEVADMLENMFTVISSLGYVPNVTQALGAPWIECGDRVGLLTFDGGFETFVFRRTLKGIQNLRDTYESRGDELNEAISNFGYSV